MAIRKSELYRSLWEQCDELRGSMDASQYKDYILALLFVKYVSDRQNDPTSLVTVPAGGSFADMTALDGKKDIGEGINKVLAKLAEANDLQGVIDAADFNDESKLGKGQEMVDKLSKMIHIFNRAELNFSQNSADGDDLLGDAYEYLMRHFATESGKAKGQFYTPAEVSRVMAKLIGVGQAHSASQTIYDPTCGSGSLLLKAHSEAKSATGLDLAVYGQEKDNATSALSRMNMILHGCATAEIHQDNTLAAPWFKNDADPNKLKAFDYIVANPPFSTKSWAQGFSPESDQYGRFPFGLPPAKNGDFAFLLHILASLKSTGTSATILPHGVLFRGGAEATIRKEIVKRGYIKAIVGLPTNLFYGTGIPAAIIVMDKEQAGSRTSILMVDASKGFAKDGAKNRLRERDIHRVVDAAAQGLDIPGYARMVPIAEIADPANDYNLNLARYIASIESGDIQDLDGHLHGGIPASDIDAMEAFWSAMPGLRDKLFKPADRPGFFQLRVAPGEVPLVIEQDSSYQAVLAKAQAAFDGWLEESLGRLSSVDESTSPKQLGAELAESLLTASSDLDLVDRYAMYQLFMDYWNDTLQDDIYLICAQGWLKSGQLRKLLPVKDKNGKDKIIDRVDLEVGAGRAKEKLHSDLLPASVLIREYLPELERARTDAEIALAAAEAELVSFLEEHAGEDGLLTDVLDGTSADIKRQVKARKLELAEDPDGAEELSAIRDYETLAESVENAKRLLREATATLTEALSGRYVALTDEDVRRLARRKWGGALGTAAEGEQTRTVHEMASQIQKIEALYRVSLPALCEASDDAGRRVAEHLSRMGIQND